LRCNFDAFLHIGIPSYVCIAGFVCHSGDKCKDNVSHEEVWESGALSKAPYTVTLDGGE